MAFDLTGVPGKSGAISLKVDRGSLPADVLISPVSIGPRGIGQTTPMGTAEASWTTP